MASIPAGDRRRFSLNNVIDSMMIEYNILLSGVGLLFTATILYLIGYRRYRHGLPHVHVQRSRC
ncbi:MAG: hypothetical protein MZU97_16395 [Bacillus subtilis]|nr:hypothetical protein [Bacillus subtilis]